jgi:hypothetical protein
MRKLATLGITIFAAIPLLSLMMSGCSNNGGAGLPCSKDYNCPSTQRCYQGICVATSEIPVADASELQDADIGTPEQIVNDTQFADQSTPTDRSQSQPDESTPSYPPEPHGADIGDVIIPIEFTNCDDSMTYKLRDYYQHPSVKVILFVVHTGW